MFIVSQHNQQMKRSKRNREKKNLWNEITIDG